MSIRVGRLLLVLGLATVASGAPGVVRAALDVECCERGCDDPSKGTPCPLECMGPCAHASTTLAAGAAPCLGREPIARSTASGATAPPVLPLVVTGVFHPPRS